MDLMRDATEEYKAQLKKVNPDFDAEHYDRLILEADEPQTPALEGLVGFDQLYPIETPGITVGPSTLVEDADASTSQSIEQLAEKPADPPTDQPTIPPTTQPIDPPANQEAA